MTNTCNENESIDKTFAESKFLCCNYFFEYELPKTEGLFTRLKSTNRVTVGIDSKLID